jgi:hypothetical protein
MANNFFSILFSFSIILSGLLIQIPSEINAVEQVTSGNVNSYANATYIPGTGFGVSNVGDVNGDGFEDIIIDDFWNNTGGSESGRVFLFFGKATGWQLNTDLSTADASWYGSCRGERLGGSMSAAGDVNGDGFDDIIIGHEWIGGKGQAYLIFGKSTGWAALSNISTADVIMRGAKDDAETGFSVAGVGDVNGDGLDDVAIGTHDGGTWFGKGKVFLVFGRKDGWNSPMNLTSKANASFTGEGANDRTGIVSGRGDVNGDHLDDFLITSKGHADGKVYLIFGKKDGWSTGVSLANVNASYVGLANAGVTGIARIIGDVNGDNLDDFLIPTPNEGWNKINHVYLFFGMRDGWKADQSVTVSNASFKNETNKAIDTVGKVGDINGDGLADIILGSNDGHYPNGIVYLFFGKTEDWGKNISTGSAYSSYIGDDKIGLTVGGGDFNGDGYSDLLTSCYCSFSNPSTYVLFLESNDPPISISSVKAYSNKNYDNEIDSSYLGQRVFIEVLGTDGNSLKRDMTIVNISSNGSSKIGFPLGLNETGNNTGHYRGSFVLMDRTHKDYHWLGSAPGETVKITSIIDNSKSKTLTIGSISLEGKLSNQIVNEDFSFNATFRSENVSVEEWTVSTNASWLSWNSSSHNLSGTPMNKDVGWYYVNISLSDIFGGMDFNNFSIRVDNVLPEIITPNVPFTDQNDTYNVDYNCTDDGSGVIRYHLTTNATWLTIDTFSGRLQGKPGNSNIGSFWVNVSVDDGNGGSDWTNFTLTVSDVNDPPLITSIDHKLAYEDKQYYMHYNATDVDIYDTDLSWAITTNARWLHIINDTAELNGTPTNDDVGIYNVNVTVIDSMGAMDSHDFELTVVNKNDPPVWVKVPWDQTLLEDTPYLSKVKANDIDPGSRIYYNLQSIPYTNISINHSSGNISWAHPTIGKYLINISASDTWVTIFHTYNLTIVKAAGAPKATLVSPEDGSVLDTQYPTFKWNLTRNDNKTLWSDLYIGKNISEVATLDPATYLGKNLETDHFTPNISFEKGDTYYWTVSPRNDERVGICTNGIWSFSIAEDAITNAPPSITSLPLTSATVGKQYFYDVNATDLDTNDLLSYNLTQKPNGMTIDTQTGLISWIPANGQVGKHKVSVVVTDGKVSTYQDFIIQVILIPPTINHKPEINPISDQNIQVGQMFQYSVHATDIDIGNVLVYSISDPPIGMTISVPGMITWTPDSDQIGEHIITIKVNDGRNETSIQFKITVHPTPKDHPDDGKGWTLPVSIAIIIVVFTVVSILVITRRYKKEKA